MKIEVVSLDSVLIDGVEAGKLVDTIHNHKPETSEMHAAIVAWLNGRDDAQAVDKAAALAKMREEHGLAMSKALADLAGVHAAELQAQADAYDLEKLDAVAKVVELSNVVQATVKAMAEGTVNAKKAAIAREEAELEARLAKIRGK